MKRLVLLFIILINSCSVESDSFTEDDQMGNQTFMLMPIDTSQIGTNRTGSFNGLTGHNCIGQVTITQTATGLTISFSDGFAVTDGPELYVTLAKNSSTYGGSDTQVSALTSINGAQNYMATGISIGEYNYVHIWCRPFNIVFGTALLSNGKH